MSGKRERKRERREETVQSGYSDHDKPFIATNLNLAIHMASQDLNYVSMIQKHSFSLTKPKR